MRSNEKVVAILRDIQAVGAAGFLFGLAYATKDMIWGVLGAAVLAYWAFTRKTWQ